MYSIITKNDFINEFRSFGRMKTTPNGEGNFTEDALEALFDWLEEVGNDLPHGYAEIGIELDVIGLCCQFSEYVSALEAVRDIDRDDYRDIVSNNDEETAEENALDWLMDQTTVIDFDGGIIIDSEF